MTSARPSAPREVLSVRNAISISERAELVCEESWVERKMMTGMTKEAATSDWQEALASGAHHVLVDRKGRQCICREMDTLVANSREQAWHREVQRERRDLVGTEAIDQAFVAAQNLARLDLPAEESFAIVGGRLLREPGSLPSLPASSSGHCPLATRGRVDEGEITLSQEAKRSGSGSLQDAGTSPSEKKRRLADSLVARAERVQQLRTLVKNLNRGVKAVQQLAEHKNFEVALEILSRLWWMQMHSAHTQRRFFCPRPSSPSCQVSVKRHPIVNQRRHFGRSSCERVHR